MRALALTAVLLMACGDSVATGDRSAESAMNAFALGYFAGLTIGVSDVALGGLMNKGQRDGARADRAAHESADWLGKALGFGTLIAIGWRIYARRRRDG